MMAAANKSAYSIEEDPMLTTTDYSSYESSYFIEEDSESMDAAANNSVYSIEEDPMLTTTDYSSYNSSYFIEEDPMMAAANFSLSESSSSLRGTSRRLQTCGGTGSANWGQSGQCGSSNGMYCATAGAPYCSQYGYCGSSSAHQTNAQCRYNYPGYCSGSGCTSGPSPTPPSPTATSCGGTGSANWGQSG